MRFNISLCYVALCSMLALPSAIASSCCRDDITTSAFHDRLLKNYIAVWGGDLSLMNATFHPDVVLYTDRFPSKTGSTVTHITNRAQYKAFVERSRSGWETYYFQPIHSVAADHSVAVRWAMHGVVGNFTLFPTTLEAGDPVTYNGTDFLVQDKCTGQIREAYIASDTISWLHAMGLNATTV